MGDNIVKQRNNESRLSIENLVKMNEKAIGGMLRLNNYNILVQDTDQNIDTYIIEKQTGMGGIALLTEDKKIKIILGNLELEDYFVTEEEFNDNFEIYERY